MRRLLGLLLVMAAALWAGEARAVCVLPYILQNGTIPDATQVMADFYALQNCVNAVGGGGGGLQPIALNPGLSAQAGIDDQTPLVPGSQTLNVQQFPTTAYVSAHTVAASEAFHLVLANGTGSGPAAFGSVSSITFSGGLTATQNPLTSSGTATLALIGNNTVLGNVSGVTAIPVALTQTQLTALCNTFTSSLLGCVPASGGGTSAFLRADGTWIAPPGGGSGTVTSITCTSGLTGGTITTTGTCALDPAHANAWTAVQTFADGDMGLNGAISGTTTLAATAVAGATRITFPAVTDTVAVLGTADQTVSGGANVTSQNLGTQSSGTLTIDCGSRPIQFYTNGGAHTLAAPSSDGSCLVLSTNNASAGTITFSGFTVGSSTGDALTTTNGNKFTLFIWRANGTAGYRVAAHQ